LPGKGLKPWVKLSLRFWSSKPADMTRVLFSARNLSKAGLIIHGAVLRNELRVCELAFETWDSKAEIV